MLRIRTLMAATLVAAGVLALAGCIDSPFQVFSPNDGVRLSFKDENPQLVCTEQNQKDPRKPSVRALHFVLVPTGNAGHEYVLVDNYWTSLNVGPLHFHPAGDGLLIAATTEVLGRSGQSMFVVKQDADSLTFYDINDDALDAIAKKHNSSYDGYELQGGTADDHRQAMIEAAQSDLSKTATVGMYCAVEGPPAPVPDVTIQPPVQQDPMPPDAPAPAPDTAVPAPETAAPAPAPDTDARDTPTPDAAHQSGAPSDKGTDTKKN